MCIIIILNSGEQEHDTNMNTKIDENELLPKMHAIAHSISWYVTSIDFNNLDNCGSQPP